MIDPGKQQVFLNYLLDHHLENRVKHLDQETLTPSLRLKCRSSIPDAVAEVGKSEEIGRIFAGFQKDVYL